MWQWKRLLQLPGGIQEMRHDIKQTFPPFFFRLKSYIFESFFCVEGGWFDNFESFNLNSGVDSKFDSSNLE